MEIININSFLNYYEKTRAITLKVLAVIPKDQLDWSYMRGKFTIGDLVRHIAAAERDLFTEIAIGNKSRYKGCGKELADGYDAVMQYFSSMHEESVALLKTVSDAALGSKVYSVDGREIELRNFLRALIVHEIHHRASVCIYLNLLGVETPPIIGLKEEQ